MGDRGRGGQCEQGQREERRAKGAHRGPPYHGLVAIVIASDLAKDMAGNPLLRGVSFKLERRDRLTLSGRNGSGKTTLLRMLAGETGVDGGQLAFAKDTRLALHDQRPPRDRDRSLRDYVLGGCGDLLAIEARLGELEHAMAAGATDSATLDAYARAQGRLEHAGGYGWREGVNATLHGLGFRDEHLDRELASFSGGELTRASLARSLAGDPDLLLLDEPTNHLDIAALEWLEKYLQSLDAAVVLVAHDRWFLEAVGTAVLELEGGRSKYFKGTLARVAQGEGRARAGAGARDREAGGADRGARALRHPLPRRHARAPGAGTGRSSSRRSTGWGAIRATASRSASRSSRPSAPAASSSRSRAARCGSGERELLRDAELWLERGEHVTLVGRERLGQDDADPSARRRARPRRRQAAPRPQREARRALPACGGDRPHGQRDRGVPARDRPEAERGARRCSAASCSAARRRRSRSTACRGGERRRLSLAILVHSGANVLILDEPTNHLDLESREALEEALQRFPGALLLISHDRALLDAVGTRTIAVEDQTLHSYVGGWPEYVRLREERTELERDAKARAKGNGKAKAKAAAPGGAEARFEEPAAPGRRLEAEIEHAETALAALE